MNIPEIFGSIADKRAGTLDELINQNLQEHIDIRKQIKGEIKALRAEALTRGSKTERFEAISKEIAFLIKIEQAIKRIEKMEEKKEQKKCKCGKLGRPHWDNGLYCGDDMCDECFEEMRRECRSW